MNNMPEMKVGIVAVSRDCFPESLSVNRRENLVVLYPNVSVLLKIHDDIYVANIHSPHLLSICMRGNPYAAGIRRY